MGKNTCELWTNRFTRMAISKEIGGLIASGFGPILAGIFLSLIHI